MFTVCYKAVNSLLKSSVRLHRISVVNYEMGVICFNILQYATAFHCYYFATLCKVSKV